MIKKERVVRKEVIEDKAKRINLKSKRKRTLIRKAIEVSQMCELDILILIQDRETNKLIEYNSGGLQKAIFTISEAIAALKHVSSRTMGHQLYTDKDYEKLKQT